MTLTDKQIEVKILVFKPSGKFYDERTVQWEYADVYDEPRKQFANALKDIQLTPGSTVIALEPPCGFPLLHVVGKTFGA